MLLSYRDNWSAPDVLCPGNADTLVNITRQENMPVFYVKIHIQCLFVPYICRGAAPTPRTFQESSANRDEHDNLGASPAFPPQPYGPLSGGGALFVPPARQPRKEPHFKPDAGEMDSKGLNPNNA